MKILYYRRKKGLSQEELAKELFVSRQTVSLWETGQTVPTIDNLIRLREIFGVSIDELLSSAEPDAEKEEEGPAEVLSFSCDKKEAERIVRGINSKPFFGSVLLLLVLLLLPPFCAATKAPDSVIGISVGLFFPALVLLVLRLISIHKAVRTHSERIAEMDYEYRLFSDHIETRTIKDGKEKQITRYGWDEIRIIAEMDDHLLFDCGAGFYALNKAELAPDSLLLRAKPKKRLRLHEHGKLYYTSLVLFALTLVSIPIAAFISTAYADKLDWSIQYLSFIPYILFSFVGKASAAVGITLKAKREYGGAKNIISGCIVGGVLSFIGYICFWVLYTGGA